MKTILIATDFSRASRNASFYALAFAKEIDANIYLFNSYKVPRPSPGLNVSVSRYDVMMQTDRQLLDEADRIELGGKGIEIICDEGDPAPTILKLAKERSADFIIVGMKGSGKNIRKIIGSTATSLVRTSAIPVIIVPENARYTTPKKLIYATDSVVPGSSIPVMLEEILHLFNSKVFVVKVVNDSYEIEDGENYFSEQDNAESDRVTFQYSVDSDITHALDKLITKHHADMLVMMPHRHDWVERLFKKSETKEMIFHSHIPVLILPNSRKNIHHHLKKESGALQINSK